MTDYSELKRCIAILVERGDTALPFEIASLQALIAENEALNSEVEFHVRNAKLMEKSLTLADRAKFQKEQKIRKLENSVSAIRLALGRFCWIADYPNDDSPDIFDKLHKDAERYRWLREQHWDSSPMAVVFNPKVTVKLGAVCPSGPQLDQAIDEERLKAKTDD